MDTPKHWAKFLDYVDNYNKEQEKKRIKHITDWREKQNKKSWYKKVFNDSMMLSLEEDRILNQSDNFYPDIDDSLINYYRWDVRFRQKKSTKRIVK